MERPTICTIIAKNYLAQARCLTDSFLQHHPEGEVFVLVIDEFEGYFDPADERFTTVCIDEIGIEDLQGMIHRYTVLELSTAAKPFFLEHLFRRANCDKICYVDPDIYFYRPISEIWGLLDSHGVVLTPHLLDFLEDEYWPNELDVLRSGSYNLGFIGLSRCIDLDRLLRWWQRKVTEHCVVALDQGLFVDQKWMDLAPSLFSSVYIHRDPGCNVAYWNLKHRHIECEGEAYTVNGTPLKFFHFSGFSPERINVVSKHQDRFTLHDLPNVRPLFEAYRDCLFDRGYAHIREWSYTHNYHRPSGLRIPDLARPLWKKWETTRGSHTSSGLAAEDDKVGEFLSWINEPIEGQVANTTLTRLAIAIYEQRPDLQAAFPDVLVKDRSRYARWFLSRAKGELALDDFFIRPMRETQRVRVRDTSIRGVGARLYMSVANLLFRIGVGGWLEDRLGKRFVDRVRSAFVEGDGRASGTSVVSLAARNDHNRMPMGLNVVGYVTDETGVGEVARASMRALRAQGFPVAYTRVASHSARKKDHSVLHMPEGHPYGFNLLCVNADQAKIVYEELGPAFFAGKHNIAYWHWELDPFPDEWSDRFQYFDEIWVASSFVQQVLAPVSRIPVIVIGAPIEERAAGAVTRDELGLPHDRLIFLFVFDMLSYIERKNPFGVIEAYRRAFGPDSREAHLVIKVSNLDRFPDHGEQLRRALGSVSGTLIDRYLDREILHSLFHLAGAYVSLHRSEALGLTIAEAMRLGKPTIATAYSSTQDYLNVSNGYPVGYELIELEEDYGPYRKGGVWADADLDQAAAYMRHVVEYPEEARRKGQQAAADIQRHYSGEAVASHIVKRLKRISSWRK